MSAITILVGNAKGGVGKTMTAVHIAELLAAVWEETVVAIDMDRQGSLAEWWDGARANGDPLSFEMKRAVGHTAGPAITAAQERASVVVIDAAPGDMAAFADAASRAHVVIIPTKPQDSDWTQATRARSLLRDDPRCGAKVYCLLTMVREGMNAVAELAGLLAEEEDGSRVGLARRIPMRETEANDVFRRRPQAKLPGARTISGLWIAYADLVDELSHDIQGVLAGLVPA